MSHHSKNPAAPEPVWAELLPWYANGTLAGRERRELEEHLGSCLSCRRELDELTALREAVAHADDPTLAPERNFARLMARIDAGESASRPVRTGRAVRSWRQAIGRMLADLHPAVRVVLATQTALVVALSALLIVRAVDTPDDQLASFRTLSDSGENLPDARTLVRVVFAPGASSDDRRRALQSIGARVVAGPGDSGAYTVAIAAPEAYARPIAAAAIDALRANPAVSAATPVGRDTLLSTPRGDP